MNPFLNVGIPVPGQYIFALPSSSFPSSTSSFSENRFILAAHISWVREVISENKIPQKFPTHDELTDDEVLAFLSQGKSEPLGSSWLFLYLTVVKVNNCTKYYRDFEASIKPKSVQQSKLTWPQLIDFIGESNFNHLWEQPYISFLPHRQSGKDVQEKCTNTTSFNRAGSSSQQSCFGIEEVKTTEKNYLTKLLRHLYPNSPSFNTSRNRSDSNCGDGKDNDEGRFTPSISTLSQALSILVMNGTSPLTKTENESMSYFFCFYPFVPHNLQDCVKFSPFKLNSHLKYLFILYQILQFIRDFRDTGIPLGDLSLSDFRTDECLYLNVLPQINRIMTNCELSPEQRVRLRQLKISADDKILNLVKRIVQFVRRGGVIGISGSDQSSSGEILTKLDATSVSSIIRHWCEGLLTNYDYLMFINFLSGRICDGNPNFHPVFPWITDFTLRSDCPQQSHGGSWVGWRDLSKSKFRLNKGERQLDLMYEEAGEHNSVPHHVTDILSEITYYVYKARQTSKKILTKFVRPKWVPAEYPVSIQRMQEWTPDECIPEFYDDPSVFRSIHPDLPDLQVPKWSKSPDDFIVQHRQLLESDSVSGKLHHWIDLTFGYKLSGNAAIRSKNIYLALADNHQNLEKSGILQLFHTPHPPRRCRLRDSKNAVTYAELKRLRESDPIDDLQSIDSGPDPSVSSNSTQNTNLLPSGNPKSPTKSTTGSVSSSSVWKNIGLPKHYDPMGFLNDFEVSLNFFRSHFNEEPNISLLGLKDRELCPQIKLFGCLLVELTLASKFCHVSSVVLSIEDRFQFYKKSLTTHVIESIPLFAKRAIQAIFLPETLEYSLPIGISIDLFLLGDRLSPLPFPRYFAEVFKMVRTLRNFDGILQTAEPSDTDLRVKVQQLKVKSFSRDLISMVHMIDDVGLDIILPFIIELLNHHETRVLSVWNLFCPISRAIGRKKSIEYLLQPIVQIYESDYHSEKHLKLFHRGFLLQLMSCFSLQVFLENFATLLIEAIGGWKNSSADSEESKPRTHLNSTHMLDIDTITISNPISDSVSSAPSSATTDNQDGRGGKKNVITRFTSRFKTPIRADSESASGGDGNLDQVEPEMFLFEPETSASDYDIDGNGGTMTMTINPSSSGPSQSQYRNSRSPSISGLGENSSVKSLNISDDIVDDVVGGSTPVGATNVIGSTPVAAALGSISERDRSGGHSSSISHLKSTNSDISEMCCESIVWLAHRLGPVLSAKFLTRNLLRMLTLCYYGHFDGWSVDGGSSNSNNFACDGDEYSNRVLECLIAISDLYGDCFIERQYVPYAIDLIHSATVKKMNICVEASILGVGSLLQKVFVHMPDALLLSQLKEPLMNAVLSPLVSFVCTDSSIFPSGAIPRAVLATKTVAMLNSIRKKIGPDLSQLHLKPLIIQICSTFHSASTGETQLPDMKVVFGASLAHQTYTSFCDLIQGTEYEPLIKDLYYKYGMDHNLTPTQDVTTSVGRTLSIHRRRPDQQQSSFGSRSSFGNRIQIQEPEVSTEPTVDPSIVKCTTRHLRGNWLIYWDHEVGRSETRFDFKQIKLQNFVGHTTGAVRAIYVLNNENSFLTASKDKTVKLWSLRNQGDETTTSSPKWTYANHKKSVLSVIFNETLHLAASTDGFIHVWDPFVGKQVRILDQKSTKGIICSLKCLENSFVGAGIDSSVHIVDPRSCHSFEMKIGIGQNSGLVRCMSVSPSRQLVSVGHSSGMISTLDLRNGTLLGSWKAHEGEILQLINYSDNRLISSSFDQNISVWNLDENRLAFHMRGPTEPVHSISSYGNELITCTTSNRIGVHSYIDPNSDFSSTRLRSDTFKGIVTTMTLLPLNQVLLVGSDIGNVSLLC